MIKSKINLSSLIHLVFGYVQVSCALTWPVITVCVKCLLPALSRIFVMKNKCIAIVFGQNIQTLEGLTPPIRKLRVNKQNIYIFPSATTTMSVELLLNRPNCFLMFSPRHFIWILIRYYIFMWTVSQYFFFFNFSSLKRLSTCHNTNS